MKKIKIQIPRSHLFLCAVMLTCLAPACAEKGIRFYNNDLSYKYADPDYAFLDLVVKDDLIQVMRIVEDGLVKIDTTDSLGMTALMYAAQYDRSAIAEYLIHSGAQVDLQNKNRSTALMIAVEYRNKEIVEILLDHKANSEIKDCFGNNARDLAVYLKDDEILNVISKYGESKK